MAYTHFRYIGYQVPTVGLTATNDAIYGIPPGNPPNPQPNLLGDVGNLGNDAKIRVERFIQVMFEAKRQLDNLGGDNAQTLKIFMAPEFYFRPNNNDVAYSTQQYRAIKDVLRKTIQESFSNWLVIPGTIMWKWNQDTPKRPNLLLNNVYFNTSLYIYKQLLKQSSSKVIEKAFASDINGIPTGQHGNLNNWGISTDQCWDKYHTLPKRKKHEFSIGGIRCGLEICLEHILPSPANTGTQGLLKSIPEITDDLLHFELNLHLLTAGGMPIDNLSVAAKKRGYILRNDGYSNNPQTNCQRVNGYNLNGSANLALETTVERTINLQGGNLFLDAPLNDVRWPFHPQQIKIYQRRQI